MSQLTETAREVAADRAESGYVVLPRSTANGEVKERGEFERISHEEIREGFAAAGWEYARHLYFHPEKLHERAERVARDLRAAGRLLVTHERICDELAGSVTRSEEGGWTKGAFVDAVHETFADLGWEVTTLESPTRTRTVYLYPLHGLFEEHYPRGLHPHSPADLFSYYVSKSVELARAAGAEEPPETAGAGGAADVETVDGIGPTYGERLRAAGIETVADLAAAEPAAVAAAAETGTARAGEWVERARE